MTLAYWLVSGLAIAWAIAGIVGTAVWAALWPVSSPAPPPLQADPAVLPPARPLPALDTRDWRSIAEGIPAPAIFLDGSNSIVASNAAAVEAHALRPGQHVAIAMRAPGLLDAVERARHSGEPQSAAVRIAMPVERSLTVHVTPLSRVISEAGPALLIVLRDRTEEQQLAQLRADFVANASHELRTPLASVKGFIETLRGAAKDDPEARERFLGIMQDQAERMSRLIDDLLSLSRVEMREHLPPRDAVDLVEIAHDVAGSLQSMAQAAGQTLTVTARDGRAEVRGDRSELAQVVQNLVQNAIKYGRRDGRVDIRIARSDTGILLAVSDDGIGIAPEHVPRLTERFYRVSAKDSRERGGTGLGLAIVKHIVNRHRGELRISSELGKGSTFTVLLPFTGAAV